MRTFRQRLPYTAIVDRPKLALPGGARVAVWVIVNVEEWSEERAMPRTVLPPPFGQPLLPDLPESRLQWILADRDCRVILATAQPSFSTGALWLDLSAPPSLGVGAALRGRPVEGGHGGPPLHQDPAVARPGPCKKVKTSDISDVSAKPHLAAARR